MINNYRIANLQVLMDTYGRTEVQARQYLSKTREKNDIVINSMRDVYKNCYPEISDDLAEYMGTGSDFYRQLLFHNGTMIHASAVVVDDRAYLFSADSGTGKSTHTQLWREMFREKAYILNDDKPAVRKINGIWYAFGTPWSGKYDISVNAGVPVAGIALLERSENNEIIPLVGLETIFSLYKQVIRPKETVYREKILDILNEIITEIPIWKLKCNMEKEAAIVAYRAMSSVK